MIKWRDESILDVYTPIRRTETHCFGRTRIHGGVRGRFGVRGRISLGAINKPDHRIAAQLPAVQR